MNQRLNSHFLTGLRHGRWTIFVANESFDAGCGGGHHIRLVAPAARHVTGVDLNTAAVAEQRLADLANVTIHSGDIARYDPSERYDVVYCIGVIHHTDNPDETFNNLKRLCKKGGLLIIWCYSQEGNVFVQRVIEPLRKKFLRQRSRKTVEVISHLLTAMLYVPVYTLYLMPLPKIPFHEYFQNLRRLSFY